MRPIHIVIVVMIAMMFLLLGVYIRPDCPPCKAPAAAAVKAPPKPKTVNDGCSGGCPVESLGPGYVRTVDWYRSVVVYENEYGFVKAFDPVCGTIPLWQGMRLNRLEFHWRGDTYVSGRGWGCYKFDDIEHSPGGDLK